MILTVNTLDVRKALQEWTTAGQRPTYPTA